MGDHPRSVGVVWGPGLKPGDLTPGWFNEYPYPGAHFHAGRSKQDGNGLHLAGATPPVDRATKAMLMKYDASDEEILAYYREHHNPYITGSAKKHWRYSMRWWHLAAAKERAEEQERRDAERRLCEKLWPSRKSTPVPAPRVIPRLR